MSSEVLISLLTFGGTLLLVVTGLLNFSVFVRQLRAAREQLETAQRELELLDRGESNADRWQVEQRIKHAENQLAVSGRN